MDSVNLWAVKTPGHKLFRAALVVSLLLTAGCLANYGSLKRSQEISKLFEAHQVLPDYHYYYTGGKNNPRVIMGIRRDYVLKTSAWIPMEGLDAETLKRRVKAMTHQLGYGGQNQGGVLYSPSGQQVGVWYSKLFKTSVMFGENNEISVSVPRWHDTDGGNQKKIIRK